MRVRANLAFPYDDLLPGLVLAVWAAALAALAAGVLMVRWTSCLRDAIPPLEAERARMGMTRRAAVEPSVGAEELAALRKNMAALNRLGMGSHSPSADLSLLERLTPPEVRFVSLQWDGSQGTGLIVAESARREALASFLSALEKGGPFTHVRLRKQNRNPMNEGRTQFFIELSDGST